MESYRQAGCDDGGRTHGGQRVTHNLSSLEGRGEDLGDHLLDLGVGRVRDRRGETESEREIVRANEDDVWP